MTKISVAGGFFYWSVQQGIWGTADQGAEAGRRIAKVIAPATAEYIEKVIILHFKSLNKLRKQKLLQLKQDRLLVQI